MFSKFPAEFMADHRSDDIKPSKTKSAFNSQQNTKTLFSFHKHVLQFHKTFSGPLAVPKTLTCL